jgi:hypothetical protein
MSNEPDSVRGEKQEVNFLLRLNFGGYGNIPMARGNLRMGKSYRQSMQLFLEQEVESLGLNPEKVSLSHNGKAVGLDDVCYECVKGDIIVVIPEQEREQVEAGKYKRR